MRRIIVISGFLLAASTSFATPAQMNATLNRISTILSQINPLINLAEHQQPKQARIKFNFKQLRRDIGKIQSGISEQINRVTIEPRNVKPLAGDYLPEVQRVKHKGVRP